MIEDFLILYPDLDTKNVNDILYRKKEFFEDKLYLTNEDEEEGSGEETKKLLKYQEVNARLISILTNFDKRLLWHHMGRGKTLTAIYSILLMQEQSKYLNMEMNKALVLLSNDKLIKKFKEEVFKHFPELFPITEETSETKKNKMLNKRFIFDTYISFANNVLKKKMSETVKTFSYTMIVCDEIHSLTGLRSQNPQEYDNIYTLIHKFLHKVVNSKILLLSGTPMTDSVDEISSVMNLILSTDEQLPEQTFTKEYFNEKNLLKESKKEELKDLFKNKISFLRNAVNIKYDYITNKEDTQLKFLKLYYDEMSRFQTKQYLKIKEEVYEEGKGLGFRKQEQYASSFIFPDGTSGTKGYNNYVTTQKKKVKKIVKNKDGQLKTKNVEKMEYKLKDELIKLLKYDEETKEELNVKQKIERLRKYSSKFASAIEQMYKYPTEVCFWFSEFVHETGTILFSLILKDVFNFVQSNGKKQSTFSYCLIKSTDSSNIYNKLKWLNSKENVRGELVKVIISSKVLSTGYDLFNVKQVHIDTAHWNFSQIDQTVSRALRFNGDKHLKEAGIDSSVKIYLHTATLKNNIEICVDEIMYNKCEEKDYKIKQIERIAKIVSIDCALNYDVNIQLDKPNKSRECDYQECEYKCDGISKMKLTEDNLIKDTYRILYQHDQIEDLADSHKYDLLTNQNLNANIISDNIYANTKTLFKMINDTDITRSRLGFGCFIHSTPTNIFLGNDTHISNKLSSWYSTFPMISYYKDITEILKDSNIVNEHIQNKLDSIKTLKTLDEVKNVIDKLPSWIYSDLLKEMYKLVLTTIKDPDLWSRELINSYSNKTINKIILSTQDLFFVYPKLFLLNINDEVWKFNESYEWVLQTGTQTDPIINVIETKFKKRATKLGIDFIGKIQGDNIHTFKLLQTNIERSSGRDIFTVPIYYYIYFIIKFNISSKSSSSSSKSDNVKKFIKNNKDVKEFDNKYSDTDLAVKNWSSSQKLNVLYWLTKDNFKNNLSLKILKELKENKLLISV